MSRYESARELAMRSFAEAGKNTHPLIGAYLQLCDVCYRLDEPKEGLSYAQAGETKARSSKQHLRALASFLAWGMLFTRQLGDVSESRRLHNAAQNQSTQIGAKLYESYYNAMCMYYELEGDFDRALKLRDAQLPDILAGNSIYEEGKIRVWRLRLLTKMGLPLDDEVAAARAVAGRMMKPDFYLAKLDRVLRGDVSDRW